MGKSIFAGPNPLNISKELLLSNENDEKWHWLFDHMWQPNACDDCPINHLFNPLDQRNLLTEKAAIVLGRIVRIDIGLAQKVRNWLKGLDVSQVHSFFSSTASTSADMWDSLVELGQGNSKAQSALHKINPVDFVDPASKWFVDHPVEDSLIHFLIRQREDLESIRVTLNGGQLPVLNEQKSKPAESRTEKEDFYHDLNLKLHESLAPFDLYAPAVFEALLAEFHRDNKKLEPFYDEWMHLLLDRQSRLSRTKRGVPWWIEAWKDRGFDEDDDCEDDEEEIDINHVSNEYEVKEE